MPMLVSCLKIKQARKHQLEKLIRTKKPINYWANVKHYKGNKIFQLRCSHFCSQVSFWKKESQIQKINKQELLIWQINKKNSAICIYLKVVSDYLVMTWATLKIDLYRYFPKWETFACQVIKTEVLQKYMMTNWEYYWHILFIIIRYFRVKSHWKQLWFHLDNCIHNLIRNFNLKRMVTWLIKYINTVLIWTKKMKMIN